MKVLSTVFVFGIFFWYGLDWPKNVAFDSLPEFLDFILFGKTSLDSICLKKQKDDSFFKIYIYISTFWF